MSIWMKEDEIGCGFWDFGADHVELRVVGVSQQPHEVRVVQVAADVNLRDEILNANHPATL